MPRKSKGARLYQHPTTGIFQIRDGAHMQSTGARDRREAEGALAAYIATRGVHRGTRGPDQFPIAEALDIYGREHAVTVSAPERIGYAFVPLLGFWGDLKIADVKGATCRRYAKQRVRTFKDGSTAEISDGTVRRELNVLQAAINHCHAEGYLTAPTKVTLPSKPPARERWLTRDEVARLIRSARRTTKGKHVARFILLAVYTGTRKDAILRLGFMPNTVGGWIDTKAGIIHRIGRNERVTNKRRGPVRMSRKVLSHCKRWEAEGSRWAVQFQGARVADIKRAFENARDHAGLHDVTPHTLKHTAITWGMQRGMDIEQAAYFFATSADTIRKVYYHHHPDFQSEAADAMDRKL